MKCPKCGAENFEGATFCSLCFTSFVEKKEVKEKPPKISEDKKAKPKEEAKLEAAQEKKQPAKKIFFSSYFKKAKKHWKEITLAIGIFVAILFFIVVFYRFSSVLKSYRKIEGTKPSSSKKSETTSTGTQKGITPLYTIDKNKKPNLQQKKPTTELTYPTNFELSYTIWEFHPNFIKITIGGTANSDEDFNAIKVGEIETYVKDSFYELEFEGNLTSYSVEKTKTGNTQTRNFCLYPQNIVKAEELFTFELSFKAPKMPQVNEDSDFKRTVSIASSASQEETYFKRVVILAIPSESNMGEASGLPPYLERYQSNWRLYFYDLTSATSSASINRVFTFISDAEYLDVSTAIKKI